MTVRKRAILYLKEVLDELVTSGDLGIVVLNPTPIEVSNYYPYVWVTNGPDIARDLAGTRQTADGSDHYVEASSLVRIIGDIQDATLIERLEDLIGLVIAKVTSKMAEFRGLTPAVHITEVLVAEDPDEDIQRDIGSVTIRVTYSG